MKHWLEAWLLVLTSAVIFALVFYVVKGPVEAAVITAFGVPLGALVWHGVVAVKTRKAPTDTEQ